MLIAVDGPLASGKGTIARALAARFGLPHLDTGTLYRAVAVAVLEAGEDPVDAAAAEAAALALDPAKIEEAKIRTAGAGAAASIVSAHPRVRAALKSVQQTFARQPGGAILDGRDIGTVIAPDADVKLFVTASADVRASRRWSELVGRGETVSLDQVKSQLAERDGRDASRLDAPLMKAEDAFELDTSDMDEGEAIRAAIAIVEAAR
ncbi:MAG: cytidylate kinase Cmk [Oceanicaulis sp. HLUCCA04]|nr:MAG: cytidylate kinase Cmk [Oceanicaulis sp. HLUCCA04]